MVEQNKVFKIGTRGSLLARTQTGQVKMLLEDLTDHRFEIVTIKTQGDIKNDVPLWQLEGDNFFTKELDQALISQEVDLVVHSFKDLGTKRPEDLFLGAITKRDYAHDILLIKKDTINKLPSLKTLTIGTSSPRRKANIEYNLKQFLPYSKKLSIKTLDLRGNINTRIEKLKNDEYHAIVLALAGIERLATSDEKYKHLCRLLDDLTFMLLPQSHFTSAAGQGALAIEISQKNKYFEQLKVLLQLIDDSTTREEVEREKKAFAEYGEGCHLAVGINVRKIGDNYLHIHQGHKQKDKVELMFLENERIEAPDSAYFLGVPYHQATSLQTLFVTYDELIEKVPGDIAQESIDAHFIVTSSYCIPKLKEFFSHGTIWSSGHKTMIKLAQEGFWVHGTADSQGENYLKKLLASKSIQIMLAEYNINMWKVLTNDTSSSDLGDTIPCYSRKIKQPSVAFRKRILETRIFYWSSFFQYQTYISTFPQIKNAIHCCGLGKTFTRFTQNKIEVLPFCNIAEFINWIQH